MSTFTYYTKNPTATVTYTVTTNTAPYPLSATISVALSDAIFSPNWSVTGDYLDYNNNLSQSMMYTLRTSGYYNASNYNCFYVDIGSYSNIQTITFNIDIEKGVCAYEKGGNFIVINNSSTNVITILGTNIGSGFSKSSDRGDSPTLVPPLSYVSQSRGYFSNTNYWQCNSGFQNVFGRSEKVFYQGADDNINNFGIFEDPCGLN